jgi:ribosome-interacting GTPase 1
MEELEIWDRIPHYVPIAGKLGWNFDELLETIWNYLDLIRVYTKPKVGSDLIVRAKFQTMRGQ